MHSDAGWELLYKVEPFERLKRYGLGGSGKRMNSFWNWIKDPGTQAMLVLFGTLFAFIAALCAFYFGRKSLTKNDLTPLEQNTFATTNKLDGVETHLSEMNQSFKRVEDNTAETSEHLENVKSSITSVDTRLKKQEDIERLRIRASMLSIKASGNASGTAPFELLLVITNTPGPNLIIARVGLYNEGNSPFGEFQCIKLDNPTMLTFRVEIPMANIENWFHGGTPIQFAHCKRLKLRMCMSQDGIEADRDISVIMRVSNTGNWKGFSIENNS